MSYARQPSRIPKHPIDKDGDASFDLSPTGSEFALPTSSQSSSSSSSRSRLSSARTHASSPLRNTHMPLVPKPRQPDVEDDDWAADFDIPQDQRPRTVIRPSAGARPLPVSSFKKLDKTVIAQGPKGVGTVTRLKSAPTKLINNHGTVKARAKAIEKNWEADFDFGDDFVADAKAKEPVISITARKFFKCPKKNLPGPDALDDLDDLFDDEEDNQATLKAGDTLKAKLPPPRKQPSKSTATFTPEGETEDGFVLPLNLTNLTLVSQSHSKTKSGPRSSIASTTDWDVPTTPNSGDKFGSPWDDSPQGAYETSATSISEALRAPKDVAYILDVEEDDDMEAGLVLPEVSFFDSRRHKELNDILDKRRRPQFAPTVKSRIADSRIEDDEDIEDGFVLENPRFELSRKQLNRSRLARTPLTPSFGKRTISTGQSAAKDVAKEREKTRENDKEQREHGWGRNTPLQRIPSGQAIRERTQSGIRSHSVNASGLLNDGSVRSTGHGSLRDSPHRPRTSLNAVGMMAPPSTPSGSRQLRHQKSQYHLPPRQSPSLHRIQSLASLSDARANKSISNSVLPETPASRYHNSTSRLTMPTTSSRAKARPPLFPVFSKSSTDTISSASSVSTAASARDDAPKLKSAKGSDWTRFMSQAKRGKVYGDGTELDGIEDLTVEDEPKVPMGVIGLGKPTKRDHDRTPRVDSRERDRKKSDTAKAGSFGRRKGHQAMTLIRQTDVDLKPMVGGMKWNAKKLRWEEKGSAPADFSPLSVPSVRPALITREDLNNGSSLAGATVPSSRLGSIGNVQIVGDMKFDPQRMCWVSTLNPEDEEPDPFDGIMADDEDDDAGGTIRAKKLVSIGGRGIGGGGSSAWSSRMASESTFSIMSWEDRRQPSLSVASANSSHVLPELIKECAEAEERHRREMQPWRPRRNGMDEETMRKDRERREADRLWEIRKLVTETPDGADEADHQ